jgi:uncharacterized protein YjbJ (UPF0337 family)/ElaB/YqjD/DUF883 family membrane-anchored ribosome-binding protein
MESMKHFTFDNRWDEIKGKLKQRYGQLTDDDLTFAEGKGDELLARLREKLGVSSDDLDGILDEFYGAGDRTAAVREKASEIAGEVRAKATAAAHEVKAQAGVAYDQARQQATSVWHDGEEYIRQNPRESLITALFAGFVAGLLIRR